MATRRGAARRPPRVCLCGGALSPAGATVILAMGAGKKAAESMHQYLQEKHSK